MFLTLSALTSPAQTGRANGRLVKANITSPGTLLPRATMLNSSGIRLAFRPVVVAKPSPSLMTVSKDEAPAKVSPELPRRKRRGPQHEARWQT